MNQQGTPCKFGSRCREAINTGACKDWHPKEEWTDLIDQYKRKQLAKKGVQKGREKGRRDMGERTRGKVRPVPPLTADVSIAAVWAIWLGSVLRRKRKKAGKGRRGAKQEAKAAKEVVKAAKSEAKEAVRAVAKQPDGVQRAKSRDISQTSAG